MRSGLTTVTIHGRVCHIYDSRTRENREDSAGGGDPRLLPVFYWGVGGEGRDSVSTVVSWLEEQLPELDFVLAAFESDNWNDDFSPWAASAVFGKEDFGGKAEVTLKWLTEHFVPYVESKLPETVRFLVGYSLAGLFSLWVYCACVLFTGAVSCSGSLWYEGWMDYVRRRPADCRTERSYLYLSLGDREELTKNRRMSTVGDNTRESYALLCRGKENVEGVLEWNQGGHFSETDLRISKGIYWILKHFDV